jgi:hypothetical protein
MAFGQPAVTPPRRLVPRLRPSRGRVSFLIHFANPHSSFLIPHSPFAIPHSPFKEQPLNSPKNPLQRSRALRPGESARSMCFLLNTIENPTRSLLRPTSTGAPRGRNIVRALRRGNIGATDTTTAIQPQHSPSGPSRAGQPWLTGGLCGLCVRQASGFRLQLQVLAIFSGIETTLLQCDLFRSRISKLQMGQFQIFA